MDMTYEEERKYLDKLLKKSWKVNNDERRLVSCELVQRRI
jgi:hypothetical protein